MAGLPRLYRGARMDRRASLPRALAAGTGWDGWRGVINGLEYFEPTATQGVRATGIAMHLIPHGSLTSQNHIRLFDDEGRSWTLKPHHLFPDDFTSLVTLLFGALPMSRLREPHRLETFKPLPPTRKLDEPVAGSSLEAAVDPKSRSASGGEEPDEEVPAPDWDDAPPDFLIRTPEDAEFVAAQWLAYWERSEVHLTPPGADGGIDIWSKDTVGQVKLMGNRLGRPALQQLLGAATAQGRRPVFFSLSGYSAQALEFANANGMALFSFDRQGTPRAENRAARDLMRWRQEDL